MCAYVALHHKTAVKAHEPLDQFDGKEVIADADEGTNEIKRYYL